MFSLKNIDYPESNYNKSYEIVKVETLPYSTIQRIIARINLPDNLLKEEVIFNIKYCTAEIFNDKKPDALGIFVYCSNASNFLDFEKFNVAKSDFAPFGDWGKAERVFFES